MELCCILTVVAVMGLYVFVKTHRVVHLSTIAQFCCCCCCCLMKPFTVPRTLGCVYLGVGGVTADGRPFLVNSQGVNGGLYGIVVSLL